MSPFQNPLMLSFGLGTWGGIRFRMSWLQPIVWLWLWFEFKDAALAAAISGVLLISVLLHEIGHVIAARKTGGSADEIVIWPLGGLAAVEYGRSPQSRTIVAAAGPLVNLLLLLACLPYTMVWAGKPVRDVGAKVSATEAVDSAAPSVAEATVGQRSPWNPTVFPISSLSDDLVGDLQVIAFSINWMLFLLNLIPVSPLDGYNISQGALERFRDRGEVAELMPRVGLFAAVAMILLTALFLKNTTLLGLFSFLGVWSAFEYGRGRTAEAAEEGFLGYDFSEGYTSLEREGTGGSAVAEGNEDDEGPRASGFWQQWKDGREAERERRERELVELERTKLDELLAKVHERGMSGLSDSEKRELKLLSERLRSRGKTT